MRVFHKENGGLSSARNAGLAIASGDRIMHLDGDDWIAPDIQEGSVMALSEQREEQGVYDDYRKSMCWRMLKATQELVLDKSNWKAFQEMVPQKKHYIWDCPYINRKLKMNMWCLTHHLSWISLMMLNLRKLRHGRI